MSPDGIFHKFWDLYVIILLLYTAFFMPYKLAFIDEDSTTIIIIDYIVDISFWLDIVVNFLTAYECPERSTLIKNSKLIAANYLSGWFFLDFTACIPLDAVMNIIITADGNGGGEVKLARLARLYRLWRLVRIMRMSKILKLAKSGGLENYVEQL
jgi:hypothetical protein